MSGCGCAAGCASNEPVSVTLGGSETRLHVDGLCCESESALVRKHLQRLEGVASVEVHLVSKQVVVQHAAEVPAVALVDALNRAGFASRLVSEHGHAQTRGQIPWLLVAIGVLLGVSLLATWWSPARWAGAVAALAGVLPIARKARSAVRARLLDMNVLMTAAIVGALAIGEWTEAAAVVFLFGVSDWLEARSLDRARHAIGEVMRLAPEFAVLFPAEQRVPVGQVPVGARVVVRAGERVPLDGTVREGSASVDESALTGESRAVHKQPGDSISAGTLNQRGFVVVETSASAADSTVSRMARLVEESQAARAPIEQLVDRFARIYTPAVFGLAVLLALVVPLFVGGWGEWFYRALVLLVVACPCALVISTPVAVVSGLARAARDGVLIKGGVHLETLGRVRVVGFDKTGTLTSGHFGVVDCVALNGYTAEEMHRWLSLAEHHSSHPLAAALLEHAPLDEVAERNAVVSYDTIEGEGIAVHDGEVVVHVGNHRLAERMGWQGEEEERCFHHWQGEGKTVVYLGVDGRLAGLHALADVVRPEAPAAVLALRAAGLRVVMLTGDNAGAAHAVAERLGGLDEVAAELLPADKVGLLNRMRARGPLAMVGDGINDAPALAAADVGIAMGVRGTAVAMETADVGLMTDDLGKVAETIALGRRVVRTIRANVAFAVGVKLIVIALASLGWATLWMAVVADVGATLAVVLFSLLLLRPTRRTAPAAPTQTPALADG